MTDAGTGEQTRTMKAFLDAADALSSHDLDLLKKGPSELLHIDTIMALVQGFKHEAALLQDLLKEKKAKAAAEATGSCAVSDLESSSEEEDVSDGAEGDSDFSGDGGSGSGSDSGSDSDSDSSSEHETRMPVSVPKRRKP